MALSLGILIQFIDWEKPKEDIKDAEMNKAEDKSMEIIFRSHEESGRRMCPGEGLGMRVMALSLGTLIQCFDWEEATDESQGPLKTNLNKPKKRPLEIVFRPREALTQVLAQL
ncbi:hypothetical protein QYF36_011419 [Acer negundo]|nr:hypothetical protein QYF36_011419 [Acer negundo]